MPSPHKLSVLVLSYLAATAVSNPVNHHARQLRHGVAHTPRQAGQDRSFTNRIASLADLEYPIVESIPLQRSPHDLQHSSRALRKRDPENDFSSRYPNNPNGAADTAAFKAGSSFLHATGASFLAQIKLGSQSFYSVVDTGSSDTWVVHSDFTCVQILTNQTVPRDKCFFGPQYKPGSEFKRINDQNFNITYGDGEFLTGMEGTLPVTLAGLTVQKQQVALPTLAAWQGDGVTSGIIGLAYPDLTASYPGNDPRLDRYCAPGFPKGSSYCNQIVYSSLINTMFNVEKIAQPVFAMALKRDTAGIGDGGVMTIGGIPQLAGVGVKQNAFASTPIKILPRDDRFRYYLMGVDGLVMLPAGSVIPKDTLSKAQYANMSGSANSTMGGAVSPTNGTASRVDSALPPVAPGSMSGQYILDSGTTLSFLPPNLVQQYVKTFDPPATYDRYSGFWFVNCNAKVPPLGIKIGGKVFWHNPKDLVKVYDWAGTMCITGVQDSARLGGINILGDVFMNNVLAVFDLGQNVIRFAARRDY